MEAASSVFNRGFVGYEGGGMSRGPSGREEEWYSDGEGILTDKSLPLVSRGAAVPLSLANLSAKSLGFIEPLTLEEL